MQRACTIAICLTFALTAGAQDASTMTLDGGAVLRASAGATLRAHCGGVRPSRCEEASRTFRIRASADAGEVRSIDIELSSPGPRPTRARIGTVEPSRHGVQPGDPSCPYAALTIRTATDTVQANHGELELTEWTERAARGSFTAVFSDPRAPRTLRGTFRVSYRPPAPPPPCGAEPLP